MESLTKATTYSFKTFCNFCNLYYLRVLIFSVGGGDWITRRKALGSTEELNQEKNSRSTGKINCDSSPAFTNSARKHTDQVKHYMTKKL